ncbi:hypothetical protein ACIPC1_16455 [Streptomyces sp. NPDC087263]
MVREIEIAAPSGLRPTRTLERSNAGENRVTSLHTCTGPAEQILYWEAKA